MTREEAIYCLKSYQPDAPDDMCMRCKYYGSIKLAPNVYTCMSAKAREMAIQALEKENIYDDKEHYVTISKALYDKLNIDYEISQEPKSPCDVCRYNPPSSTDGKPCTMCPAEGREE